MAGVIHGNVFAMGVLNAVLSPVSVAANTTAEQLFTVTGLRLGDVVFVNKPTTQAGLGVVGVRAAVDTLSITYSNNTAGAIVPTFGETYRVTYVRPDSAIASVVA